MEMLILTRNETLLGPQARRLHCIDFAPGLFVTRSDSQFGNKHVLWEIVACDCVFVGLQVPYMVPLSHGYPCFCFNHPAGGALGERLVGAGALHGGHLHQRPPGHGGKHRPGDGLHGQRQVVSSVWCHGRRIYWIIIGLDFIYLFLSHICD